MNPPESVVMSRHTLWHGCLFVPLIISISGAVRADEPVRVRSRTFDIDYSTNGRALPLSAVRLWYTLDRGESWLIGAADEDRHSPIAFEAPREGLYGFFLVLENATGPSSAPPNSTTQPHLWSFVDYTVPVVQLHPLRQTTVLGHRVLQIRWTAIDAHFGSRPVEIQYRRLPAREWHHAMADLLPNTGRYDWRLPTDLDGSIAVRVNVRDLGGHHVESEPEIVEIHSLPSPVPAASGYRALSNAQTSGGMSQRQPGSVRAKQHAARLFAEAIASGARGDYRKSIAGLREVVRLNPQHAEAFAEIGEMLYRIGDSDRALNAYELALQQQPAMRTALRGAARVYRQRNDLAAAASRLRTILRHNPNDAAVWVNLGDIAIYQGDDVLARECYTRATQIDPTATQAIEDAQRRLNLMAEVSRTYRPTDR